MEQNPIQRPQIVIKTSLGNILAELFPDQAPRTVANFLSYVDAHFYDDTLFHRVIPKFMIQGGGFSSDLTEKATQPPIKNEATNGLSNLRGTMAMARTQIVDSATSQFYINVSDNTFLDHQDDSILNFGYCVFGQVLQGIEVVDQINLVPTHTYQYFQDVPQKEVKIIQVARVETP